MVTTYSAVGATTAEARLDALRNRIATACRLLRGASVVWAAWTLALILFAYADRDAFVARLSRAHAVDPSSFSQAGYLAAFVLMLAAWSVTLLLVAAVWRLTRGYLMGEIFTAEAAQRLRMVGLVGFVAIGADVVARPIQYALLSRELILNLPVWAWLQPQDLLYAIICGFLLALAAIFGSAAEIAEDHAQFV